MYCTTILMCYTIYYKANRKGKLPNHIFQQRYKVNEEVYWKLTMNTKKQLTHVTLCKQKCILEYSHWSDHRYQCSFLLYHLQDLIWMFWKINWLFSYYLSFQKLQYEPNRTSLHDKYLTKANLGKGYSIIHYITKYANIQAMKYKPALHL